jgi:hypothetical protein
MAYLLALSNLLFNSVSNPVLEGIIKTYMMDLGYSETTRRAGL